MVLAYMVSPYKGSEYSVAWNYITYMSKQNDLVVLYGSADEPMGNCKDTEEYIKAHPMPHVRLIPVYPNALANILNWPNRHRILVYTFYYAYKVWMKQAYDIAKELISKEHFDLIHYVGMIGYREPGYLWKLGLPYVWGPVGGANNAPMQLMKRMPLTGKLKLTFRSVANTIQFHTKTRLKKALAATEVLLTATSENQRKFKEVHHKDSICLPENGITTAISLDEKKFDNPEKYHFVIIGRLDANKSVGTFLEALTQVKHKGMLHIDIVGGGPLRSALEQYAGDNGLSPIITWYGQVPREEAVKVVSNAHMHVITSVSEGNPTTIWEAMSYGVPTMSFDHCGMHDTIDDSCGIRIPIAPCYEDCVSRLAKEIDSLLEHPERFKQLAEGTVERAKRYTWDEREKFWNRLYDDLLKRKNS